MSDLNPLQTLLLVWSVGAVLTRCGDSLHIDAPQGAVHPRLLDAVRENKVVLLAMLPESEVAS